MMPMELIAFASSIEGNLFEMNTQVYACFPAEERLVSTICHIDHLLVDLSSPPLFFLITSVLQHLGYAYHSCQLHAS